MENNVAYMFKSTGERKIAQALTQYGIPFIYEPRLQILEGHRKRHLLPDFFLPTPNVYLEYFGRTGNDSYDSRSQEKLRLYRINEYAVAALYPWDLCRDWPGTLLDRIRDAVPSTCPSTGSYRSRHVPYVGQPRHRRYRSAGRGYGR